MMKWFYNILPVYEKESLTSSRTVRLTAIVLAFNLILTMVGLLQLQLMVRDGRYYGELAYSSLLHMYMLVAVSEAVIILFIVPALTAGSVSGERERQTLDLLLCTRLRPIDIVIGKLMSCLSTVFVMMVTSLPILALVYIYGGIGLVDLGQLFLCMGVTALFIGSISIFFSSVMKRTTVATVLSYVTVIFVAAGTILLLILMYHLQVLVGTEAVLARENMLYPWNFLLLLNPVATFYSLLVQQIGMVDNISVLNNYGNYIFTEQMTTSWWWLSSCLVQLILSVLFIWWAGRALCPLRKK